MDILNHWPQFAFAGFLLAAIVLLYRQVFKPAMDQQTEQMRLQRAQFDALEMFITSQEQRAVDQQKAFMEFSAANTAALAAICKTLDCVAGKLTGSQTVADPPRAAFHNRPS